jgi:hypothetical protein
MQNLSPALHSAGAGATIFLRPFGPILYPPAPIQFGPRVPMLLLQCAYICTDLRHSPLSIRWHRLGVSPPPLIVPTFLIFASATILACPSSLRYLLPYNIFIATFNT